MSLTNYTQTCYVVDDLDQALGGWIEAGAGPFFTVDSSIIPGERLYRGKVATDTFRVGLGFIGTTQLEIIQPTDEQPSIFREVMGTGVTGNILHHVQPSIRVKSAEEFEQDLADMEQRGYRIVQTLTTPDGLPVRFFENPQNPLGYFIELARKSEAAFAVSEAMYRAHLGRRSDDPIRPMSSLQL